MSFELPGVASFNSKIRVKPLFCLQRGLSQQPPNAQEKEYGQHDQRDNF
jgi:hypothetical protein